MGLERGKDPGWNPRHSIKAVRQGGRCRVLCEER